MTREILIDVLIVAGLAACASALHGETLPAHERIQLSAGKSFLVDTKLNITRVSYAAPEIAEAVPVGPRTVMINGKAVGETSVIVWMDDGSRREFDVAVRIPESRVEDVRKQLGSEFAGNVSLNADNGSVYLTGTVHDLYAAQRAVAIAEPLGHVVNLLSVKVPARETQILLKIRFADVDRTRSTALGINFAGAPGGLPFSAGTGQLPAATVTTPSSGPATVSLSDALNLLFFDPHINVGATLQDLESKAVLQILAEPNLLAMNGRNASFISGGEFPVPVIQGTGSGAAVNVTFRQFGVQIRFLPVITPRGTIRLHVVPEVSSLDYSNAVTLSGFTIPALTTRRVETDVELENGQSFAIAGLLDQRTTDSLSRIPGLADIPFFGKLFTSKSTTKSNSELLVIVTPELVGPIADPKDMPGFKWPVPFLNGEGVLSTPPQTPGPDKTGPLPAAPVRDHISIQEMEQFQRDLTQTPAPVQNQTPAPSAPSAAATTGAPKP